MSASIELTPMDNASTNPPPATSSSGGNTSAPTIPPLDDLTLTIYHTTAESSGCLSCFRTKGGWGTAFVPKANPISSNAFTTSSWKRTTGNKLPDTYEKAIRDLDKAVDEVYKNEEDLYPPGTRYLPGEQRVQKIWDAAHQKLLGRSEEYSAIGISIKYLDYDEYNRIFGERWLKDARKCSLQ